MTPDQILWMGFGAIGASVIVAVLGSIGALINHWTRELKEERGDPMSDLHMLLTEMTVSVLPIDHEDRSTWSLSVAWRGGDRYAVAHGSAVLALPEQPNTAPTWEWEPRPSSRTAEFAARTRFDYHTAYRLACEQAPLITVNGMTAADVLALTVEIR